MPIDEHEEIGEVILFAILIVQIIGMFPEVYYKQWCHIIAQRAIAIGERKDLKLAYVIHR